MQHKTFSEAISRFSDEMESEILSEESLKKIIEEKMKDNVVTILCDDPSDLEILESKLKILQIVFVLYCPFDPYNHGYDVIKKFLAHVRSQNKGSIHPTYLNIR